MIEQLFPPALVHALGWTLIHTLWQGALFALFLGVLLLLLRKFSAQARYLAATGLLAGFFLTVIFTFSREYVHPAAVSPTISSTTEQVSPQEPVLTELSETDRTVPPEGLDDRLTSVSTVPSFRQRVVDYYNAHLPLIVTLWLMGVFILQLRFLGQLAFVQRLKTYGTERFPSTWAKEIQELEERLGIKKSVQYLTSFRVNSPQTIGWWQPVILFPAALLQELKDNQIVSILAHELAHIKRNDFLVNLLQTFLCTLFFYHPGLWWMSARIRDEREHCCDDLAIQVTGQPIGYAKTLIQLKEKEMNPNELALAYQGNSQTGFKRRITRLLSGYIDRATYGEGIVTALLLILAMGTAVYAANYQMPTKQAKIFQVEQEAMPANDVPIPPSTTAVADSFDTKEEDNTQINLLASEATAFELLMEAIYDGNLRLVEHLLKGDIALNQTDRRNFTPLMAAASENQPRIARILIDNGAEVNFLNSEGWTALIEAADEGAYAAAEVLLEAGAQVNLKGSNARYTALGMAASEGHLKLMRLLIDAGAALGEDGKGSSLLHVASEEGHPAVIEMLLELGANVDIQDQYGRTPLSYAAEEGQNTVIQQLLDANADPNILDDRGRSAVSYAAAEGSSGAMTFLMNSNEGTRTQALYPSVLIDAADEGILPIVKQLVAAGSDVNAADQYGNTPLMAAAREGELAVARYLLDQGAEVLAGNEETPLSLAARESDSEMVRLLMDNGAKTETYHDFESISMNKWRSKTHLLSIYKQATPLLIAIEEGNAATVRMILNYRPDVKRTIRKLSFKVPENTSWEDFSNQSEAALLAKYDLRYNVTGWTSLMEAVETGNLEIVNLLLDAGAQADAVTSDGMTALDLARQLKFAAIARRLAEQ